MEGRVVIRGATTADLPALRQVFRRASYINEGDQALLDTHPELREYAQPPDGADCLVAVVDGRIAGFASASWGSEAAELVDLFVDPDHLRQGIGRRLVAAVVDAAGGRGIDRLEVDANRHALTFYERVGFVAGAEVPVEFGTAVRMSLPVSRAPGRRSARRSPRTP